MTFQSIMAWLRQDTTINGIGLLAGTIAGAVTQVMTHQAELSASAGVVAAAAIHLIAPGNAREASTIEKLATDMVQAAVQRKLAAAMPGLIEDGAAVMQALKPANPPVAQVATPSPAAG